MQHRTRGRLATPFLAAIVFCAASALAGTPEQKCQAGKNKAAGMYAACRQNAAGKLATTGDGAAYLAALSKCAAKNLATWQKLEANAAGACPSSGDEVDVANMVNACTSNISTAVAGGALVDCPAALMLCSGDLLTCQAGLSGAEGQNRKTGQASCFHEKGTLIACAGTGQDGELQKGVARSYTNNGDGTITDNSTGLMWEKLSDDGSIHDKDDQYSWADAFAVKIATLNSTAFAGYGDWRLPNRAELASLVKLGGARPSVDAAFSSSCSAGCTVTSCSCTRQFPYWSSTSYQPDPVEAWQVNFDVGHVGWLLKSTVGGLCVRAVRGG